MEGLRADITRQIHKRTSGDFETEDALRPVKRTRHDAQQGLLEPIRTPNLVASSSASSATLVSDKPSPEHRQGTLSATSSSSSSSSPRSSSLSPSIESSGADPSSSDDSNQEDHPDPNPHRQSRTLLRRNLLPDGATSDSTTPSPTSSSSSISQTTTPSPSESPSPSEPEADHDTNSPSSDRPSPDSPSSDSSTFSDTSYPDLTPRLHSLCPANLKILHSRLETLLPRLQAANEILEKERERGELGMRDLENLDDVAGGEGAKGYIEMELGLGVLEERRGQREREVDLVVGGEEEEEEEAVVGGLGRGVGGGSDEVAVPLMQERGGTVRIEIVDEGDG